MTMVKNVTEYKTTTYKTYIQDFMIDIVEKQEHFPNGETETWYEAWLYRNTMGVKNMIVGVPKQPGKTILRVAEEMFEYCMIDWGNGTSFERYDKEYGNPHPF